ncbi:MAG: hypothetical protein NZ737_00835, partial [Candidatus Poseidoniaceae archaeon]|nr:hypothetical protein [Candidatus Poseidoniaceae archaeon]
MRPTFTSEYGGSYTLIEPGSLMLSGRELVVSEPYFIGQRPVTQVEWASIMKHNPSKFQEGWAAGLRPVERVSWLDCQDFINLLNDDETSERLGLVGRWGLPTAT